MQIKLMKGKNILATAMLLSFCTSLPLIILSIYYGKKEFFLLMNNDWGIVADNFFHYWTYLGDGIAWVIVSLIILVFRKNYAPLLFAAIVISTLLTQITKNFIMVAEPRPTAAITDINTIHTVMGVELHKAYSFPSGHTETAFSFYFLACFFINKKWMLAVGFLYACLVGYSRIYLAQHFPLDVGGGIITALITIYFSILIQQQWEKKKLQH